MSDIDECQDMSQNNCEKQEYCFNVDGNYTCKCPKGFYGNATETHPCTRIDTSRNKLLLVIKIIVGESQFYTSYKYFSFYIFYLSDIVYF